MSFQIGLSGLEAASKRLNVAGHNIANASTVGFKSSRAEFADIYNAGGTRTDTGNGVRLANVRQSFTGGVLNTTGNVLDMGIQGSGFFIMNDQGAKVYTRAGQFNADTQDYIVNSSGQRLTGLLADANGNITPASGDLKINRANITPQATTTAAIGVNLDTRTAATPRTVAWSGGASPATDTYNNTNSSTVYDSLGNSHVLNMYFIAADASAAPGTPNAGVQNQWYVAFQLDNQDLPPIINPPPATMNYDNLYSVTFNPDGTFSSVSAPGGTTLPNGLMPLTYDFNNGSNIMNFNVDLSKSTQFGSPYNVNSIQSNGYTTGSLAGLSIDQTGVISGTYSNGQSLAMGQIQLANFADVSGLQNAGNTSWLQTLASGQPLVSVAGSGGVGAVKSGELEDSNVNLTSELVNLISAQQAFQANAKTISTEDQTIQAIFNIR